MLPAIFLASFLTISTVFTFKPASDDEPAVYYGVKDGCQLINCANGTSCIVRNLTMKYGQMPFQNYLFPKCISSGADASQNSDPDGNSHTEVNGPTCKMVQCSQGYVCQVRVSTVKVGNLPYAQSIGGFPSCVSSSSNSSDSSSSSSSSSIIVNGPGCDLIGNCSAGQECKVATGIGKVGFLPWAQYFWPFCG